MTVLLAILASLSHACVSSSSVVCRVRTVSVCRVRSYAAYCACYRAQIRTLSVTQDSRAG
eukprot:1158275-Prymnesium_polylepis.1